MRGFGFYGQTGSEDVIIVCSRERVGELERLFGADERDPEVIDAVLNRLRQQGGNTEAVRKTDPKKKLISLKESTKGT